MSGERGVDRDSRGGTSGRPGPRAGVLDHMLHTNAEIRKGRSFLSASDTSNPAHQILPTGVMRTIICEDSTRARRVTLRPDAPPIMTWIRNTPLGVNEEAVARSRAMQRALYPMMYGEPGPAELEGESIVASHALIPDAQYHAFSTFGVLMSPDLPLERRHHEMIATMVSVTNRCRY